MIFQGQRPTQFDTVTPRTSDGKIHLTPSALGKTPFRYQPVTERTVPVSADQPEQL